MRGILFVLKDYYYGSNDYDAHWDKIPVLVAKLVAIKSSGSSMKSISSNAFFPKKSKMIVKIETCFVNCSLKTDFDLEFFAPKYQFEIMRNTKFTFCTII